jgi:hypothetical protein
MRRVTPFDFGALRAPTLRANGWFAGVRES